MKFDEVGYWSEVKLELIERYAAEYSNILSAQPRLRHSYIDAFAGPGTHVRKTDGTQVQGSPVNALNIEPPFDEFWFIDIAEDKLQYLQRQIGPRADVHYRAADCNEVLVREVFEWTDATWNPVTGCTKISPGCKHCYAERMAGRLHAMGNPRYRDGFKVTLHPDLLDAPARWKRPKMIFVNSMSYLFHPDVPGAYIADVFDAMTRAPQHTYQVLTKRPERMLELSAKLPMRPNIWLGTSVESADYKSRIDTLRRVKTPVRFLSLEPLLGDLGTLDLTGIHWVIAGGESGPKARPMKKEWVLDIRRQCNRHGAAFFFKQWGGRNKKKSGRVLDGRTYDAFPAMAAAG